MAASTTCAFCNTARSCKKSLRRAAITGFSSSMAAMAPSLYSDCTRRFWMVRDASLIRKCMTALGTRSCILVRTMLKYERMSDCTTSISNFSFSVLYEPALICAGTLRKRGESAAPPRLPVAPPERPRPNAAASCFFLLFFFGLPPGRCCPPPPPAASGGGRRRLSLSMRLVTSSAPSKSGWLMLMKASSTATTCSIMRLARSAHSCKCTLNTSKMASRSASKRSSSGKSSTDIALRSSSCTRSTHCRPGSLSSAICFLMSSSKADSAMNSAGRVPALLCSVVLMSLSEMPVSASSLARCAPNTSWKMKLMRAPLPSWFGCCSAALPAALPPLTSSPNTASWKCCEHLVMVSSTSIDCAAASDGACAPSCASSLSASVSMRLILARSSGRKRLMWSSRMRLSVLARCAMPALCAMLRYTLDVAKKSRSARSAAATRLLALMSDCERFTTGM
mmetsp:Transcript_14881/g.36861  ORF Transcript_14881/g.36861 Transcript_14881/m.36861 type:complete len:451 (-) Transcript_14881:469-1821(-)